MIYQQHHISHHSILNKDLSIQGYSLIKNTITLPDNTSESQIANSRAGKGSCFCSADSYCLCTPSLAVDVIPIIENISDLSLKLHILTIDILMILKSQNIIKLTSDSILSKYYNQNIGILVGLRNNFPPGLSLIGGFMNIGESAESAVKREFNEETSMLIEKIELLTVFSEPNKDPRRHTVSIVHTGYIKETSLIHFKANDDAKEIYIIEIKDMFDVVDTKIYWRNFAKQLQSRMAFDIHWDMIEKFLLKQ